MSTTWDEKKPLLNHGRVVSATRQFVVDSMMTFLPFMKGFGVCAIFALFAATIMKLLESDTFPTFLIALHFATSTMLTVGYGTVTPATNAGKLAVCAILFTWLIWISSLAVESVSYLINRTVRRDALSPRHIYIKIWQNVVVIVVVLMIGTMAFASLEKHSIIESFYWSLVTVTTEGYGDITGQREATKIFNIFFMFFGVISFAISVSNIVTQFVLLKQMRKLQETAQRGVTYEMVQNMDVNKDGKVEKIEFLIHLLIESHKCDKEDIDEILTVFDSIDVDGDGALTTKDIIEGVVEQTCEFDGVPIRVH
eukprot:CFRG0318T1